MSDKLFTPQEYPSDQKSTDDVAYLDIPDAEHLWLSLRADGRFDLMYGVIVDFNGFADKNNAVALCPIHYNDLGTGHRTNKHHATTYITTKKNGDMYIKLKVDFLGSSRDEIHYEGLLISNADYRYFLGLLRKKGKE